MSTLLKENKMILVILFVVQLGEGRFDPNFKEGAKENANDMKYVLQALKTIEDRLTKLEDSKTGSGN